MTRLEWHPLLSSTRFLSELISIDSELCDSCRKSACPHCGGALHAGFYVRKVRHGEAVKNFDICFSLCCSAKGCRKRTLPPSVRFCGRSPYLVAVIALAEIFAKGPSPKRIAIICELLGVAERSIRRWLRSWRGITKTSWWRERMSLDLPEWQESALARLVLFHAAREQDAALSLSAILRELSSLKFCFSTSLAIE